MFKLTVIAIPLALAMWPADSAVARSSAAGPLDPLVKLRKLLQQAWTSALRGHTSAARGQITMSVRPRSLRAMKQAGVRSLGLVGLEFELIFRQLGRASYYLRSFVHLGPRQAALMSLSGRVTSAGKLYVTGLPLSRFQGIAAPFRTAARRFRKAAANRLCRRQKIIDAGAAKRMGVTGRIARRLLRDATRARLNLAGVCRAVAAAKRLKMSIRIDDAAFVGRDSRGRIVGLIKADLRLRGRRLHLRLGRFRALRP